jgi:hypothetical protein
MAAMNKSLAQMNKPSDVDKATKKYSALRDASRAERAEFYFDPFCQLAPAFNGWGLFRLWLQRANLWRKITSLRTAAERLRSGMNGPPLSGGRRVTTVVGIS